ncbi:DNA helicase MCM8-like [Elysia marginata]|uniref:DNA helicase MCM8 n=1 Tax=Elysia marginata TaxID=1093978 RepID=A0AAV4J157_9GAST|nr:DNA helicase MCM8-like [Elysia marginata]
MSQTSTSSSYGGNKVRGRGWCRGWRGRGSKFNPRGSRAIKEHIPDLASQLRDTPEKVVACLGLAMHQIVSHKHQQDLISISTELGATKEDVPQYCAQQIFARIKNFGSPLALKSFKANCFGKFVTIKGTVVRVGNIKPLCTVMGFRCASCSYVQAVNLPDGKYTLPTSCPVDECRGRTFFSCRSDAQTRTIDWQTIRSLCPSIFGHEMVKAGLILGLFGSGQKFVNDKNRIPVRGDPHVLVVGDPGLGKSQMLQAVSAAAPRSVYVCGNTTTASGLTVTLSKDGGSGDFALEAGALVLADQGCCCIDEFDKMGAQHQALLEAMEQQSISIAKAGIVCSLPARTSIIAAANPMGGHYNKAKTVSENLKLEQQSISIAKAGIVCSLPARTSIIAAANPVGGHYNKAKTVSENLKMGGALLSRFDLVFIMLDKPDEEMDGVLSEHVMALHSGIKSDLSSLIVRGNSQMTESENQRGSDQPLSERLKAARSSINDPIPHQLLRKYVGYARKYVHPKIGLEAASVIQEFYLTLRRSHQNRDSTPITTRQLESLMRLTEARARLELREEATRADAEDVVEIMKYR